MKHFILALAALAFISPAFAAETETKAAAVVGKPAPDFEGKASDGKTVKLSDFKGKTVVLEWTNPGCPFVLKHYDSKNMQEVQKAAAADGVIWLQINSSAEGKEGFQTAEEANKYITDQGVTATARILDPAGTIGHLYGAQTTPHMFVVNAEGTLVYAGAIDDNSSHDPATIKGAKNYVTAALADLKAGKPVEVSSTKSYGCGVKYAN